MALVSDGDLVDAFRFEQALGLLYSSVAISMVVTRIHDKTSHVWLQHLPLVVFNVVRSAENEFFNVINILGWRRTRMTNLEGWRVLINSVMFARF